MNNNIIDILNSDIIDIIHLIGIRNMNEEKVIQINKLLLINKIKSSLYQVEEEIIDLKDDKIEKIFYGFIDEIEKRKEEILEEVDKDDNTSE